MNDQHETETPIETLNEFMEWVQKLESGEYLFRGLSSAGYDIMASAYLRLDPEAEPQQLLEMNKELISGTFVILTRTLEKRNEQTLFR